jgi:hypothetical protein
VTSIIDQIPAMPTPADFLAWVDYTAAYMSNAGMTVDHAQSLVEDAETPELRWVAEMVRDRLKVYQFAAPWDLYPREEHGQKLALLLTGLEEFEHESMLDAYLDPIEADLIRRGFSSKVAADWCLNLVEEAVWYLNGIENAGGVTAGMA